MLDAKKFRAYASRLALSRDTVACIARVRSGPPIAPQTIGRGRPVRFASHKMGHSVSGDAHTTEGLAMLAYELTPAVMEFWEQPLELVLSYADKSGQMRGHRTRVDHLVLEQTGVFLDEWKTEEELLGLAEQMPNRYQRAEGAWRSLPAEESAAALGMTFRLRTPATIPAGIVQNGKFLRDYWQSSEAVGADAARALAEAVAERPGLTIGELLRSCPDTRADDLYLLLARGELYVDLAKHRLADTFYAPVFASEAVARALTEQIGAPWEGHATRENLLAPGAEVEMGGRRLKVVAATDVTITLRAEGGALLPLSRAEAERKVETGDIGAVGAEAALQGAARALRTASSRQLKVADLRAATLKAWWAGEPVDVPPRTLRRWRRAYQEEALRTGFGYPALIPGDVGRPPGPGLQPEMEALLETCLAEIHEVADPPTLTVLYQRIKIAVAEAGLGAAPARTTVADRVRRRDKGGRVRAQAGRKMAYQVQEYVSYLAFDTPRHGERPWERAHLDHTQLDVYQIDSQTGLPLGRPWLTLLIDAYSRRVLAFFLTFDEPSYRSTMMVLRLCVNRWGRLPEELIVDDGAEFNSAYFERLLTHYSVEKLTRRGDPRVGGLLERFFGSLNTRLLHALQGQTRPTKNVRGMSPEVDPVRRAVWTMATLYRLLDEFLYEVYDTFTHPAFGATPREVYEARMALTGQRPNSLIADDSTFFMATLPTTSKGYAKVSYERGVKINHYEYKAPELRFPGVPGTSIEVRYDPMDIRHAYGHVRGKWIELYCPSLRRFPAVGEREVAAISAELAERPRLTARAQKLDGPKLVAFLDEAKVSERVLLQRRRDAQLREATVSGGGLTAALGVAVSTAPARVSDPDLGIPDEMPAPPSGPEPGAELEVFPSYS